jgi:hypothetical protein
MAFTLNGIGTTHYGRRRLSDGTYITTEWVVIAFVPLLPLRSLRVLSESKSTWAPFSRSRRFSGHEIPLDKRQVAVTYAIAALVIGLIFVLATAKH